MTALDDLKRNVEELTPSIIALRRPGFDVDEDALPVGVHIMSLAALDLLR